MFERTQSSQGTIEQKPPSAIGRESISSLGLFRHEKALWNRDAAKLTIAHCAPPSVGGPCEPPAVFSGELFGRLRRDFRVELCFQL